MPRKIVLSSESDGQIEDDAEESVVGLGLGLGLAEGGLDEIVLHNHNHNHTDMESKNEFLFDKCVQDKVQNDDAIEGLELQQDEDGAILFSDQGNIDDEMDVLYDSDGEALPAAPLKRIPLKNQEELLSQKMLRNLQFQLPVRKSKKSMSKFLADRGVKRMDALDRLLKNKAMEEAKKNEELSKSSQEPPKDLSEEQEAKKNEELSKSSQEPPKDLSEERNQNIVLELTPEQSLDTEVPAIISADIEDNLQKSTSTETLQNSLVKGLECSIQQDFSPDIESDSPSVHVNIVLADSISDLNDTHIVSVDDSEKTASLEVAQEEVQKQEELPKTDHLIPFVKSEMTLDNDSDSDCDLEIIETKIQPHIFKRRQLPYSIPGISVPVDAVIAPTNSVVRKQINMKMLLLADAQLKARRDAELETRRKEQEEREQKRLERKKEKELALAARMAANAKEREKAAAAAAARKLERQAAALPQANEVIVEETNELSEGISILDDIEDECDPAIQKEDFEPQQLVRPTSELPILQEHLAHGDNTIEKVTQSGESIDLDADAPGQEKLPGFADSQDMFGLLSGAFIELHEEKDQVDLAETAGSSIISTETIPKTEEVVGQSNLDQPAFGSDENLLGLLSGRFETQVVSPVIVSGDPAPPQKATQATQAKPLSKAELAKKAAIANFFNPLAKRMKAPSQSAAPSPPVDVPGDDESDYGDAEADDEDSDEESEVEAAPIFMQKSKCITDLISDDSDSGDDQSQDEESDEDSDMADSDQENLENGKKQPLRAIVSFESAMVAAENRGESVPGLQKQPRNKFIEAEAEVEEDEFMNYGGIEGEDANEKNEYDQIMVNDANDEYANEEAVVDYYQQQMAAEDQEAVEALINDVTSGALRKRQSARDGVGKGLDIYDSDEEAEAMVRRLQARMGLSRKEKKEDSEEGALAKMAANPSSRAFANCFMAPFEKIGEVEEGQVYSQKPSIVGFLSSSEDDDCARAVTKIAKLTSKHGVARAKPQSQSQSNPLPPLPDSSTHAPLQQRNSLIQPSGSGHAILSQIKSRKVQVQVTKIDSSAFGISRIKESRLLTKRSIIQDQETNQIQAENGKSSMRSTTGFKAIVASKEIIPLKRSKGPNRERKNVATSQSSKRRRDIDDYDEQLAQEFQNTINSLRAERSEELPEEEHEEEEATPSVAIPNTRRKSSSLLAPSRESMKKFSAVSLSMSSHSRHETTIKLLSPEQKRDIIQIFNLFDTDGSGTMEIGELKVVLWALGFQPEPGDPEQMVSDYFKITVEEAADICLSVDDFLQFACDILTNRDQADVLKKSFACFDAEEKGYLVMKDLRRVCKEINEFFSDDDLELMMTHIDKDGGGSVTLDEWITVMSKNF